MPWHKEKRDGQVCVIKDSDGEVEGCHDSEADADAQIRALYANEEASAESSTVAVVKTGDSANDSGVKNASVTLHGELGLIVTDSSGNHITTTPLNKLAATDAVDLVNTRSMQSLAWANAVPEVASVETVGKRKRWRGMLAFENYPTDDGRIFLEWDWRDPPLDLYAQFVNEQGHDAAVLVGRIDRLWKQEVEVDGQVVTAVMGEGVFSEEEDGQRAAALREDDMLSGVSVDYGVDGAALMDPETREIVPFEDVEMEDVLFGGHYLNAALKSTIAMATMVSFPAFAHAGLALVAAGGHIIARSQIQILDDEPAPGLTAAAAGRAPLRPPRDWFYRPEAKQPTPLTVTDEGEVYGHLALWNQCHSGPEACQLAPRSKSGYQWFHLGEIETAEGDRVSVGRITVEKEGNAKGGHASLVLGTQGAIDHYDRTGCVAAFARASDGHLGIWLSGAVRSDAPAERIRDMQANPPSGDWRWENGGLELIGVLSVVVPGFAVPRLVASVVYEDEEETVMALVASGYAESSPRMLRREMALARMQARDALGEPADDWR